MRRREFLKNAASTVIAGSLGATAAKAEEKTTGEVRMSKVQANGITINYEQQGTGEPLVLIPYLAADHACYAFQVADYAKQFTCISLDPRGAGETDKPERAPIRWNCSPTTSLHLCRRLESSVRM
jgi:hypothetical protein